MTPAAEMFAAGFFYADPSPDDWPASRKGEEMPPVWIVLLIATIIALAMMLERSRRHERIRVRVRSRHRQTRHHG